MRGCGECVACCVYLRIDQPTLKKGGMVQCEHLDMPPQKANEAEYTADGCDNCTIYADRPPACRDYACTWKMGFGTEADRPDRSLMLIDEVHQIANALECKPLAPEHEETPEAIDTVIRISRETGKVALVTTFYERKLSAAYGRPV